MMTRHIGQGATASHSWLRYCDAPVRLSSPPPFSSKRSDFAGVRGIQDLGLPRNQSLPGRREACSEALGSVLPGRPVGEQCVDIGDHSKVYLVSDTGSPSEHRQGYGLPLRLDGETVPVGKTTLDYSGPNERIHIIDMASFKNDAQRCDGEPVVPLVFEATARRIRLSATGWCYAVTITVAHLFSCSRLDCVALCGWPMTSLLVGPGVVNRYQIPLIIVGAEGTQFARTVSLFRVLGGHVTARIATVQMYFAGSNV